MQKYLKLGVSYLKGSYLPHFLLTLLFCLGSVGLMSFRNLNAQQSAKVLEMYFSLVGILLMTPLFMPEQNREIWQLEKSKSTPIWQIYFIRLVIAITLIVIVLTVCGVTLEKNNSEFLWGKMWFGEISEMVFLGAIGFAISALTNQVVLGYMVAIIYYFANIGGRKYFGKLGLFQMMEGKYDFAGWMFSVGILLMIVSVAVRERQR